MNLRLGLWLIPLTMLCVRGSSAGVAVDIRYVGDPAPELGAYIVSLKGTQGRDVGGVVNLNLSNVHQIWQNDLAATNQQTPGPDDAGIGVFGNSNWSPLDSRLLVDWRPGGDRVTTSPGFNIVETNDGSNPVALTTDFLTPSAPAPFDAYPGKAGMGNLTFAGLDLPTIAWLSPQPDVVDLAYVVLPHGQFGVLTMLMRDSSFDEFFDADGLLVGAIIDGPALRASGNGVRIDNGDDSPSLADNTDFGSVVPGSIVQRSFSLEAFGAGAVNLQPPVFTGPFSLVGDFPSTLAGEIAEFTVAFDANAGIGEHIGSISFGVDVLGSHPYNFALRALVVPEPSSLWLACGALVGAMPGRRYFSRAIVR